MGDAEQKLLVSAHRLPGGGGEASVLMLRLGTGEEVALVGNPGIKPVTLLLRDGDRGESPDGRTAGDGPADRAGTDAGRRAVEAFTSATGLPATPVVAPPPWRGVINGVLYTLTFSRALDDAEVDRVAALIVEERSLPGGPARHRAAIREALASPEILASRYRRGSARPNSGTS